MAKINKINNASSLLAVDPGASGDSFIQFDINTTGEFRIGVDDDDADKFKISQGSALGTNDYLTITSSGEEVLTSNPAFAAYQASDANNVSGDLTLYQLGSTVSLTEIYDIGNNFTTGGTFTAPVTGKYLFVMTIKVNDIASSNTESCNSRIITSNRTWQRVGYAPGNPSASGFCTKVIADMDASDTCTFNIVSQTASGKVTDLLGSSSPYKTHVAGYLLS